MAVVEEAGLLDPGLLDPFEAELVALLERCVRERYEPLRDGIGRGAAEAAFGGTDYSNGLDLLLARGAAAAAELLIEEALMVVGSAASLRVCAMWRPLEPARLGRAGGRPGVAPGPRYRAGGGASPDDGGGSPGGDAG